MQNPNTPHSAPASYDSVSTAAPVHNPDPFVPPRIPVGLPHVVQFVEGSLYHLPQTIQNVGQKMSRYAAKDGVVSIALPFLCNITGLGSHHTADHAIQVMESLGVLVKHPSKGGKDRRSNTYTFLGSDRNWRPLPAEPRGTDPWVALSKSRRENEVLRAELEELKARMALMTNGHSEVTDGNGPTAPDSYESADPLDEGVAISHFGVTDGGGAPVPETTSHSYDNQDSGDSAGEIRTIGHSGVTDGEGSKAPDPTSHSYENPDFSTSTEAHGAIGHSGVTDGSEETLADEKSLSNKEPDSELSSATQEPIGHSAVTDALDQGQEYLSRRARVQELVMNHRAYYTRSFNRGGLPSAVEYFSRSPGHEQELMGQVALLEAGGDPRQSGTGPPPEPGAHSQTSEDSDRYAVGQCPDCGRPFATHGGATHCTDCTERRRRESEA